MLWHSVETTAVLKCKNISDTDLSLVYLHSVKTYCKQYIQLLLPHIVELTMLQILLLTIIKLVPRTDATGKSFTKMVPWHIHKEPHHLSECYPKLDINCDDYLLAPVNEVPKEIQWIAFYVVFNIKLDLCKKNLYI